MTASEKDTLFETAKVTTVIRMFALPAIMSSLVGSVYNIVDQIFIGQKIGTLGNAATNVAFPLVMLMVTFSMLFGVGGSSHFSLEIGAGKPENAAKAIGNSAFCMLVSGIALMIAALAFLRPLMVLCGARGQTLEYAVTYTGITAFGIPFYILGTATAMFSGPMEVRNTPCARPFQGLSSIQSLTRHSCSSLIWGWRGRRWQRY